MGSQNIRRMWKHACTPVTVAAAGSAHGDAGEIPENAIVVFVTGADATKGVALPKADPGQIIFLVNDASATLKVYNCHHDASVIGATAAETAYVMVADGTSIFVCASTSLWGVCPLISS